MMHRISRILLTAVLTSTICCVDSARGANVTYVAQENDVSQFRTTSVPKANDPDGDNVSGTAGFLYVRDIGTGNHQRDRPEQRVRHGHRRRV